MPDDGRARGVDAPPPATRRRAAWRIVGRRDESSVEIVAAEVPVAIAYNGLDHAVMMMTPENLDDFAVGFTVSETIVAAVDEIFAVEEEMAESGRKLRVTLSAARFTAFRGRRRGIVGRTGCGLCGVERLEDIAPPVAALPAGPKLDPAIVSAAVARLPALQVMNAGCGGLHAAAFFRADGTPAAVREDVGRHNALDKLIGALLRGGEDRSAGFVVLSSRASFEMADKAARAGIPVVVAVSAPTTLAIERAESAGLTLIGFARDNRFTVYCGAGRIVA